jgi:murein DD-endopeptidase MepM/ murein hydrolase activator NlpD
MNKIYVKEGNKVQQGQVIGEVGNTGRVTGPHLHWGASLINIKLDPKNLIIKEQ